MGDRERVLQTLRGIADLRLANDQSERDAVLEGRRLGISWEDLAQALKRTRSAVWQKYHDEVD